MNKYQKLSLGIALGIPIFFLIVTLITGIWGFFLWSLPPSFVTGMTTFFTAKNYG